MKTTDQGLVVRFFNLTRTDRARIAALVLLGLCLLVISLLYFGLSIDRPYVGADLALGQDGWFVQAVDPPGAASSAGIKVGDRPVEINGYPAEIFLEKYEKVGTVWSHLIQKMTVVDDQGNLKSTAFEGSSTQSVSEIGMRFLACLVFWAVGIYVFLRRPLNATARLFYLCCLVAGMVLSANIAAVRGIQTATFLEIGGTIIGPWLLLHFFLYLPEERTWVRNQPLIYLIYLPALVTLALFPVIGFADGQPVPWFRSLRLFEYGAGFLAALAVAAVNFLSCRSFKTRQQMKIVLVSCLVALVPLIIINVLPGAIWGNQSVFQSGFSILMIVFIPLGIGYAVVSQQFMDIDIIIRRGVIYGLITVIMASILGVAIFLVMVLDNTAGIVIEIVLALGLGALATALFGPAKKRIEYLVDKYLYRDRYDYRMIIQNLSSSLSSFHDLNDVSRVIVGSVVKSLNLAGGALFVKTQSGAFEVGATQGVFNSPNSQSRLHQIITERKNRLDFPNGAFRSNPDVPYMIPLVASGKEVGILCVSQKNTRQIFSRDDLFLLQGIASVTAMAVSNTVLVRDVSLRNNFVSIASHELRTPLTSIVGFAQLLIQRDPMDARRMQWLGKIQEAGHTLTAMVDDLLNITRIQSGRLALKLGDVDLSRLIEEKLSIAREITDKHEFIFEPGPGLPLILADRDKLGQVIDNLLSNATKYSPRGGKITVSVVHDQPRSRMIIGIADQGIGISPEDKQMLFTTFHRIQRPETMGIRGSGLGLYIAKEWIGAMGGEIWLESQLNKGSTFYISIPAGEPGHGIKMMEKAGINDVEKNPGCR